MSEVSSKSSFISSTAMLSSVGQIDAGGPHGRAGQVLFDRRNWSRLALPSRFSFAVRFLRNVSWGWWRIRPGDHDAGRIDMPSGHGHSTSRTCHGLQKRGFASGAHRCGRTLPLRDNLMASWRCSFHQCVDARILKRKSVPEDTSRCPWERFSSLPDSTPRGRGSAGQTSRVAPYDPFLRAGSGASPHRRAQGS